MRYSVREITWLVVLALVASANGWLISGCLVPFFESGTPDYLLLLPSVWSLISWSLALLIVLLAARVRDGRFFSPLILLLLPLASVLMLATPLRRYAGPWLYVSIDLRWWLLAIVALLIVANGELPRFVGDGWIDRFEDAARSSRERQWFWIALAALLVASSLLASPRQRFQSVLVGDEPKYLRYLENWYRGHGMDVGNLVPIAELPVDFTAAPGANAALMARAVGQAATDLVNDGRRLVGLKTAPSETPASLGGWFVKGKHGSAYQIHNPGVSFLLFPGYFVDRAMSHTQTWHPLFPSDLYFTNATMLALYVLWGLAVLSLLWTCTGRAVASWLVTGVVFLSLPTTALAYQYYPEVPAGVAVAMLARYLFLSRDARPASAIAYGLLAGFLPWLHVRFTPLAIAAAAAVIATRRGRRSELIAFSIGVALPVLALGLYYFYVTGSMMPWGLYGVTQEDPLFSAARALRDLPSFWFDRRWGLVANAPVYVLALPGLGLVWQRDKALAVAIVISILTIAIPAAGHGYTGAFTTPLRLVAAIVPLLAIPLAEAAIQFRASRWFTAAFVVLAIVSVQNGVTYNIHLAKNEAYLQGATIGGWLTPLLLPDFDAGHRLSQPLTAIWLLATAGLLLLPIVFAPARPGVSTSRDRSWTAIACATLVIFASMGSIAAAISGSRFDPRFMLFAGDARDRAIHFGLNSADGPRWSSEKGSIDLAAYFPNAEGTSANVVVLPEAPTTRTPVEVGIVILRPGNRPGWGTAAIDFGDDSRSRVPIEGSARTTHFYTRPGDYEIRVEIAIWGLPSRVVVQPIHIGE